MPTDSVEREIQISASPEIVWGVITEPEQISRWFADEAELEGPATAGVAGRLTWKPGGRAGGAKDLAVAVPIRVVAAEPFSRFAFRWNHPEGEEPDASNSALVEFTLAEQAGGTRLRVVESGIAAVTSAGTENDKYVSDHGQGWGQHLGELAEHVATSAAEAVR